MILAFLLSALLLHGSGERKLSIVVGGRARAFVLYQPDGLTSDVPLVIALHGRLGTGGGMEKLTHFEAIAGREKFLLIYPDGVRKSWNDGRSTPAEKEGVDDVEFIRALIDSAVRHCSVDQKRVYVTGISNGGFMTMRLATGLSDKIAAVAVVAATMDAGTARDATKVNPMSVLIMHGRKDPLVPIDGGSVHGGAGGPILSHDSAVRWWVRVDGCQLYHLTSEMILDSAGDGTFASYRVHPGGAEGTEVVDYVIENGGHTWPGGWQYLPVFLVGKTSRNLNASEIIWAFFQRHSRE
ncbi:MAG TPA: PHB depolymerase family esterase [Puia sp.]|nr:PHB depolymerase family esterase [Puia sp.]